MDRRSFKKKRKTAQRFGARKPKPPIVKKKFSPATSASSDDGVRHDEDSQPSTSTHGASSASIDETVDMPLEQCFVPSEETSVRRPAQAADIADAKPSTSREDVSIADAQPSTSREDVSIADAQPSTSREDLDIADAQPSTSREDARSSTSTTSSTIRARLEPRFVSAEASRKRAAAVQESLRAVSATERKMSLMDQGDESVIETEDEDEVFLVQRAALNGLLGSALCPQCKEPGLKMKHGTKHGLAVKMVLTCTACGADAKNAWSSPRMESSKSFEVNIRAMQAIKTIGKGSAALSDFWSVMNVSHRGIHHKTFQRHLKGKFRPAGAAAAANVFSDAVAAVRDVYNQMEGTPTKNVTVVYDGTWMTRGHASHIGVGTVIEFYTGLVLDSVVLSNYCHGCAVGPKESDDGYSEWKEGHVCQKNTEANSGQMEVEAALILFRRSLKKNDLRYTTIVCDGDSRTFLALCQDQTYGFIPLRKEDCINHVKKRMGTALRTIVTKSKKDQPIGGKGGLTQNLIKQLTDYYGQALRQHDEVEDMQRAVMATFYHTTSTDQDPHHELCPPGPDSWCRHRAAEAKGEPQPPHKYHLGRHVAAALLPVYQRLSDPQLLERCQGKKTQNAAESLHSIICSILPKEEHASLIAAETAVSEAICRYNAGNLHAYTQLCTSLGLQPGRHALRRAAEKDAMRKKKAAKAHQAKGQMAKRRRTAKDTKDYNPGAY